MTCEELKRIPLIAILQHLQIPCAKMNSREAWFKNPFNGGNERTASTKIDLNRNIWYCHSEGVGGNNIDFLMKYFGTTQLTTVLNWADERKNIFSSFHQPASHDRSRPKKSDTDRGYTILSIQPLKNQALLDYLSEGRKIDLEFAEVFCKEIYYQTAKGQKYFAICFGNDSGGYELRNAYDKRSLMAKDITTLKNGKDKVVLFEGFMDFLSYLTLKKQANRAIQDVNYCILNTTANLEKSYPFLEKHKSIVSYLDTDASGRKAYSKLEFHFNQSCEIRDGMREMQNRAPTIKDVNDYLTWENSKIKKDNPYITKGLSNR